jgi:conjugal transfer pilus assembly protein TraK
MLKRYCFILLILFSFGCCSARASTISPEHAEHLELSNHDINRIVCQSGHINDVYYSEEKALTISVNDNNAFVKFLIQNDGHQNNYVSVSSEIYLVCDGDVYTLLAEPKNISAQTVYLSHPTKNQIEQNLKIYGALPIEEQALDLTMRAIKDDLPDSFIEHKIPPQKRIKVPPIVPALSLYQIRTITVEGMGLTLHEYLAQSHKEMILDETDFLDTKLGNNIIAVTINPLQLMPSSTAQIYIVERSVI